MHLERPRAERLRLALRHHAGILADTALELAWPTRCMGCDRLGTLLCDDCRLALPWVSQRWACPTCGAPFGWLACTECRQEPWEMRCLVSALSYGGDVPRMVMGFKDAGELRLAPVIAAAMATALDEASSWSAADGRARFSADDVDGLVFVPSTPAAYARRGFDQMQLVSRELSRLVGVPLADVLARDDVADQRRLGRAGRADNARGSFAVVDDVAGLRLLLADDVVTTGATTRAAASALLGRGAACVTACSFARVW